MAIARYLVDDITWNVPAAPDKWGTPQGAATATAVKGRIVEKMKQITGIGGSEIVASGHVMMTQLPAAGKDSLEWGGVNHPVIGYEAVRRFSERVYLVYYQ